jgi:hypothetical protein
MLSSYIMKVSMFKKPISNFERYLSLPIIIAIYLFMGCTVQQSSTVNPIPSQPLVASENISVRLKTEIYEGPSGIMDNGTVSFKWASSLSSVDPLTLTYSSFLQGYEESYTSFLSETSRSFSGLPNGKYAFYVKARDQFGNIEPTAANRSFQVAKPTTISSPPVTPHLMSSGMVLIGADINRIAVGSDGNTVYALDGNNGRLYKSNSPGMGWTDISNKIPGSLPWIDVTVAPDDPLFVAVVTNGGREVYVSSDGGATGFSGTGLSGSIGAIQVVTSIAISPSYGNPVREIAAGTLTGAAGGKVFINILSDFGSGWFDASSGPDGWLPHDEIGIDVFAIKFSPSFSSDGTILLVGSSSSKTYLYQGMRDIGSRSTVWNNISSYPVELSNAGTGTPGTPLKYADIAFPADYNGSSASTRQVFVSWSKGHPAQDVYRINDSIPSRMNAPEAISSIAYNGNIGYGKLLAGAAKCSGQGDCYQVQTYFLGNPFSNYAGWQSSQKAPTGSFNARVGWSPDGKIAYAGTSGVESAVSHSMNNGKTWNQ